MSCMVAAPEMMTAAAADLATMGSTLDVAHMAAAASTVAPLPAAADEVSTGITHLFSQHAQDYQALAAKAATFQEQWAGQPLRRQWPILANFSSFGDPQAQTC